MKLKDLILTIAILFIFNLALLYIFVNRDLERSLLYSMGSYNTASTHALEKSANECSVKITDTSSKEILFVGNLADKDLKIKCLEEAFKKNDLDLIFNRTATLKIDFSNKQERELANSFPLPHKIHQNDGNSGGYVSAIVSINGTSLQMKNKIDDALKLAPSSLSYSISNNSLTANFMLARNKR